MFKNAISAKNRPCRPHLIRRGMIYAFIPGEKVIAIKLKN
jgi:hypothetical protein